MMAKRHQDNIYYSSAITNNIISNKKIKINNTNSLRWTSIIDHIRGKFNIQRELIKKKYEFTDFDDKEGIDYRIYYGGVNGHQVFQEMFETVIRAEMEMFFKYVIRANSLRNNGYMSKYSICHALLKLIGLERMVIAEITKTYNYEDFGNMANDSRKYDYLADEISVWPKWYNMFLHKLREIFTIYLCTDGPVFLNNRSFKYLLKNKNDPSKLLSFIIKYDFYDMQNHKNRYKCWLTAGNKTLTDYANANLSSALLMWTSYAEFITDVYPLIINNVDKWNDFSDINDISEKEKSELGIPINPYCYHMACHQSASKILDPLYSAIIWDNESKINLTMYLRQFYWRISHSSTYYRGQASISKWIVEFVFKKNGLDASIFHIDDVMIDQYALLCFFENEFAHNFTSREGFRKALMI